MMNTNTQSVSTPYLPDGSGGWRPAPMVLTESELVTVLRLDEPGGPVKPAETIRRYRDKGYLRGCKVGRSIVYPLDEVRRFLAVKVAADNRNSQGG